MARPSVLLLFVFTLSIVGAASAQKHEVAVLLGGLKTGDRSILDSGSGSIQINAGFTVETSYAQRLANAHLASLYIELPLTITPTSNLKPSTALVPKSYSAWFLTPGLKLKLFPVAGLSPYVVLGGGVGHFGSSGTTAGNTPNTGSRGSTSGVVDFGGGVEVRLAPFAALRGEIRDFASGNPDFNVAVSGGRQHTILVGAGLALRV
ncbi:MAG: outer membrane protein [Blastocatellia bacterium]